MKEIFSQVVEKEKDADLKIEEAKREASALLMNVEAENREKIKRCREDFQAKSNADIQAFTEQQQQNEERMRREAEAQIAEELKLKNETVAGGAEEVFKILTGQQTE